MCNCMGLLFHNILKILVLLGEVLMLKIRKLIVKKVGTLTFSAFLS